MSDILASRTGALDRLLQELDVPPPVPPKDDRREADHTSSENVQYISTTELPRRTVANVGLPRPQASNFNKDTVKVSVFPDRGRRPSFEDMTIVNKTDDTVHSTYPNVTEARIEETKTQASITKRKKVAFAAGDSYSTTPPPLSSQYSTFEAELEGYELSSEPSTFDPPQAPRFSKFPERLPDAPKRKPAPLNLKRPTSHTGKWSVRTEPEEIWTPIDDEPDTAAMICMDVAPKICPLPYKPVKSIPLKSRGSLRPAPLRIRKGVRFDSAKSPAYLPLKSPAYLPLKSPALLRRGVRFDGVKSPAVARFRAPPTPYSNTQFQVLTPRRKRGVRFDSIKSPAASKFKMPPTPYHQDSFGHSSSSSSSVKQAVRFAAIKSPARSRFKTPPTPYNKASFGETASTAGRTAVRFASLKSPAVSKFKNPPTPYNKTSFRVSSSPPELSPITPRAMHMTLPDIAPDSPVVPSVAFRPASASMDDDLASKQTLQKFEHAPTVEELELPPRTTSLHRRNASLPKDVQAHDAEEATSLPATTFDENAVGASTLRWLGMLPKPAYHVGQNSSTDRNNILGSYFHKSTPSI